MAFRLSIADDLATSVRACAREQLAGAIGRLEHAGDDPVDAIHDARKHLKKARALLRLVRSALGAKAYREENAALRDAALALSGARDADVLVETVEKLAVRYAGRLPAVDFEQLRDALAVEAEAARAGATPTGEAKRGGGASAELPAVLGTAPETGPELPAVIDALRAALARVENWPLERADWDTAVAGVRRAYADGREAFAIARHDPTAEHLHAWRKRVKDLWYQERLLAPVWPAVVGAHGEEAHVLSERLGDDHDLAVLRARIEQGIDLPAAAGADLDPLLALVDERREELREQSQRLGHRLYAEPPKAFTRRLARYVRAAVAEQREPGGA